MPVIRAVGRLGILDPEQIALLQEIFDLACARLDLDPKSAEAENIAQRLVATHQSGTLDRQAFPQLSRSRMSRKAQLLTSATSRGATGRARL